MKFLRTTSTSRLLAVLAGLVIAIVIGGAIAVAAHGPGPVPERRSLPAALHKALTARPVQGISAYISFTDGLVDTSDFQGTDPLVKGASGRLWLTKNRLRIELQSSNGDAQVMVNKRNFWISDPAQHVVYEGTLPAERTKAKTAHAAHKAGSSAVPTIAAIQSELTTLAKHLNISGAEPTDVAGHATYTVRVSPRHDGGLLGAAAIAWDAVRGVPLRFAVYAKGNPSPVLALQATSVSYGPVPTGDLTISPPPGSKVIKVSTTSPSTAAKKPHTSASGPRAVAAKVAFKLLAPRSLIGLPRQSTKLLDMGDKPAALVTYGQGLGGIAVIEQTYTAKTASGSQSGGDGQPGFTLPTVSIAGATGTELDTALGTVIQFHRGNVSYTVLGSVPPFAAEKAARRL